jgi:sporulation protein YlmC with PRC-barrel domain
MTKKLIPLIACCAASITLGLQAEDSSTTPGAPGSDPTSPGVRSHSSYGGAQRMNHSETRGSKLMGADVKGSQGESLGKIEDVLLNPNSGRIDFAVLSLSSSGSSGSSASASASISGSSTDPGKSASVSSSSGDKLVAIPWTLLRSSASSSPGAASSSEQVAFTFSGDASKLQAAPSFGQSNWPDISQSSWRQGVYSHFGVSAYGGGSATGASSSPGGIEAGGSSANSQSQQNSGASATPGTSSSSGTTSSGSQSSGSQNSTDGSSSSSSSKPQ